MVDDSETKLACKTEKDRHVRLHERTAGIQVTLCNSTEASAPVMLFLVCQLVVHIYNSM